MTTPTLDTVRQSYVTYADYEETGSQASCASFITACKRLLVLLPAVSSGPLDTSVEFSLDSVREALKAAQAWLAANPSTATQGTSPSVLHHDFSEFSDR